ncbi:MAG: hypothetical protein WCL49_02705 [bacterium]
MKIQVKILGLMAVLAGSFAGQTTSAGSLWDNFESYTVGDALSGKPGWGADPGVTVASNVFIGNTTTVGAVPPCLAATNSQPSGLNGTVWTDCQMVEAMRMDYASLPSTNASTVAMVAMTTDGFAVVYNTASNWWDVCSNDARGTVVSGVASGHWAQVSLCEDFSSKKVALFLNGRLLRQKVPFINTAQSAYSGLRFRSGSDNTGYVDNVYVSNSIPVALTNQALSSTNDINGDGIVDALEITQYGALAKVVPGDIATITGAVANANAGDRIVVSNGTYATSFTLSNGVTLVGINFGANATNLTIQGNMTAVTGSVMVASGVFTVTGTVSIAAGGLLTISNTAANFGGLTIGGGGLLHVVGGSLIVGSYTNTSGDFTLSLITNVVSSAGNGTITTNGTSTMISTWSNVVYTLQATNIGYVVGAVTNNGVVTPYPTGFPGMKTALYTNLAANITNNQTIVAAFVYNGVRYVPGDYGSVTGALAVAVTGDQIVVSNRTYSGSITVSNGVTLIGTNMTGVGYTNLTINGGMSVVQTGMVYSAGAPGQLTVTGTVSIAAGGLLTISNTAANFGGLTIGGGGLLQMVNGSLVVGSYTNSGSFTLSLITNVVSSAGNGTITTNGTSTMISTWSNVVYTLQATNIGYVVGAVTNNGVVTPYPTGFPGMKTALYTNLAANITNNQTIVAAFVYNGVRYVPGDYGSVTGALAVAVTGDQIVVSNRTYSGSITVSNGVTLIGTNMTGVGYTNLTINGGMSVVQTGMVYSAGAPGQLTVTGTVSIAAGGLLTISNTAANFGGLTIGGGGLLQMVNGSLVVGSYTNSGSFTLSLITNMVSSAGTGSGTITPNGTSTMISTWSNVTYTLAADRGSVVGSLTNNGVVTNFVAGTKTATYTDPAANLTNNQIITAVFSYTGIRTVPSDYGTITGALAAAQAGDQIVVSDGPYTETLEVGKSVKLVGTNVTGLAGLTVQANQNLVLSGFSSFVVSNLVIQSGATVVVTNGTVVTVGGVTLTGPFTMNSGWATALTSSSINYTNDFEAYSLNQPLALCGGQGWGASDSGSIIQGLVFTNEAKAAMVVQSSTLSNVVVGTVAQSKVWTDLWLNDSAVKYAGVPYPTTNANRAVALFVNTNNHVVIWNSNAWDECATDVGGHELKVSTGTWVRVSVFEDFTAHKVALFVNGQLLRQQVPFVSPTAINFYSGFSLSSGDGAAYMDDVKIWTNIPPSLTNMPNSDLDHDGIADAVEIAQKGNLTDTPWLAAPTVTAVGTNSATLGASVTNDGGATVTSWGTVWDTNLNPTAHMATILGSTNAPFNFSTNEAGFSPGQHYYVRGWASNVVGLAYSTNGEFYAEPVQASAITFVPVPGGFMIGWTADVTSTGTVVLVKQGSPVDAAPEDGSNYVATAFGSGAYLGVSNYIVYVGSGSNVTVNNLIYGSSYQVAAFAYAGHDNLTQYRTNSPPTCILVWPPRGSVYKIR